jgi:hypothetical protein
VRILSHQALDGERHLVAYATRPADRITRLTARERAASLFSRCIISGAAHRDARSSASIPLWAARLRRQLRHLRPYHGSRRNEHL